MAQKIPSFAVAPLAEVAWAASFLPSAVRARLGGAPVEQDGQVLDPEVKASLPIASSMGRSGGEGASVEEARATLRRVTRLARGRTIRVGAVDEIRVGGADGDLDARLYTPTGRPGRGLLVYFHGGGWVEGDLDTHDQPCRFLAEHSGHRVLSVDYRLAPEHRFPAAADDARASFEWAVEHAGELGADPTAVAVGGDSAGGNLAAVTSLMGVTGGGPVPALEVLLYPVCDVASKFPSHALFGNGYLLTLADMKWFAANYAVRPGEKSDPRVSPLLAESLAGMPPSYVAVAGFDPLRDEGIAFARRLAAEGVETELRVHRGLIHGFANAVGISDNSVGAMDEAAAAIRAALA